MSTRPVEAPFKRLVARVGISIPMSPALREVPVRNVIATRLFFKQPHFGVMWTHYKPRGSLTAGPSKNASFSRYIPVSSFMEYARATVRSNCPSSLART